VIAQKTWGSPPLAADYAGFLRAMDAVGHAPGYRVRSDPPSTRDGRSCAS
jgi:hypothetical protein